jgi:hypothetical protein
MTYSLVPESSGYTYYPENMTEQVYLNNHQIQKKRVFYGQKREVKNDTAI